MNTIIIKSQQEMDALPEKFETPTLIEIRTTEQVVIYKKIDNSLFIAHGKSSVIARNNSSIEAWDNSSVEALDKSSVKAFDNSSVVAFYNSSVAAWDNSSVAARDNSSVVARGDSSVIAFDNSLVVALDNSSVEANGNSLVVAWGKSSVIARNNSSIEAWDNSVIHLNGITTVSAYLFSTIYISSSTVKVKRLFDKSTAKFCIDFDKNIILEKHSTAQIVKRQKEISFETYLERGYIKADGILQKLISKKKIGKNEVFKVENFNKEQSFVIKNGDIFSHGKTLDDAKNDLKYKLAARDTSQFLKWNLTDKKLVDDLIIAYRAITGACTFGVKDFIEKQGKMKDKYSIDEVIEMTENAYGGKEFKNFFNKE